MSIYYFTKTFSHLIFYYFMHGGWESLKLESEKDTEDTTELEYNLTKWV